MPPQLTVTRPRVQCDYSAAVFATAANVARHVQTSQTRERRLVGASTAVTSLMFGPVARQTAFAPSLLDVDPAPIPLSSSLQPSFSTNDAPYAERYQPVSEDTVFAHLALASESEKDEAPHPWLQNRRETFSSMCVSTTTTSELTRQSFEGITAVAGTTACRLLTISSLTRKTKRLRNPLGTVTGCHRDCHRNRHKLSLGLSHAVAGTVKGTVTGCQRDCPRLLLCPSQAFTGTVKGKVTGCRRESHRLSKKQSQTVTGTVTGSHRDSHMLSQGQSQAVTGTVTGTVTRCQRDCHRL